ncbi:hypothetical protein ACQX27_05950 [Corynebacterium diphtheriae]|uniref:hypothetical protein n=1 Tax=Corynebacterium diphtheriae TaxID=1717 RepID=UPI002AC4140F|nr:hypothetical protein [Corynebacterium diphtheriae]MDZ5309616.1 hypothetical protein [Corynebacterium diphtheriae]
MGNIFIKLHPLDALKKKGSYAAVVKGCCAAVNAAFYWLLATKNNSALMNQSAPTIS